MACVGLDPTPDMIPPALAAEALDRHGDTEEAVAAAYVAFNEAIIEAIAGHCVAVKPQVACYEAYGPAGWSALRTTIANARAAGLVVVADGKRGDIGSTSRWYRRAFFGDAPGLSGSPLTVPRADWLTVNGYLGSDNITPFLDGPAGSLGLFVLVKTSNPASGELQDTASDTGTVASTMADLVREWGADRRGGSGLSDIGAVVGATYPSEAVELRRRMPDTLFLVPGFGAQGGDAADALAGARPDGTGVLISSSRGITAAWRDAGDGADWATPASAALDDMNRRLGDALVSVTG